MDVSKAPNHLEYFEEAYTSSNWLVRLYRVKPKKNKAAKVKNGIEGREGLNTLEPEYPENHKFHFSGGHEYDLFVPLGI